MNDSLTLDRVPAGPPDRPSVPTADTAQEEEAAHLIHSTSGH